MFNGVNEARKSRSQVIRKLIATQLLHNFAIGRNEAKVRKPDNAEPLR
jgi:hypothetical protein